LSFPSPFGINNIDLEMTQTYTYDDWPELPDGTPYDGTQILALIAANNDPFGSWDIRLLTQQIEESLNTRVVDIPLITKGSNKYVGDGEFS
jgi:hypothetical protein